MTDLTGFTFDKGTHNWGPMMHILDFEHPITRDLSQDLMWGTNSRLGPVFHVEDPEATVLGQVVYSQGRCKPGLAVKNSPNGPPSTAPRPTSPRPCCAASRVMPACTSTTTRATCSSPQQLFGVHTVSGGRTFDLPQRSKSSTISSNAPHRRKRKQFQVTLRPNPPSCITPVTKHY